MRSCYTLALLLSASLHAEIVDRIAATVGFEVVTETQVAGAVRVTAFLDGVEPDFSAENRRKVLDRLIDQALVRREVEFTRFAPPAVADVDPLAKQVLDRFRDRSAYVRALGAYGITEAEVREALTWQLTMLRFIEYRFQPSVQVTNAEIRQEYRRQAAAWREQHGTEPPTLQQIRTEVEKIVRQRLTDSALDRWLGEVRTQNTILYREGYKR